MGTEKKDLFDREWITRNSIEIVGKYEPGVLTLRGLHYQLVSIGMTNTITHYKRVVSAMIDARWKGLIDFEAFSDHDRSMIGETKAESTKLESEVENAKDAIHEWMNYYSKNKWENQSYYPEVFIEKKALQGVFEKVCTRNGVALGACKGYPSLTFLNDSAKRFKNSLYRGQNPIILYFGDYDPSGEDIPRAIQENIGKLGCEEIEVRRISLMENQVIEWGLPPAPIKDGDSRSAAWTGLGQVELDAVKPEKLQKMCQEAIDSVFDKNRYDELLEQEQSERTEYKEQLRDYVLNLDL